MYRRLPNRCATPTAADCIRAVYLGAPTDYAQVADIPADKLLTPASDGRYHVEREQQYTVGTAAALPAGWTRFWLDLTPLEFGVPSSVSASQLIKPIGTTYTFTVSAEPGPEPHPLDLANPGCDFKSPLRFSFDLLEAKPFVRPRPDGKPHIGDVVVTTTFQVPRFSFDSFDSTGSATAASSYTFLMPDADSATEGATTAVTTYEELRTSTTVLRVNVTDGDDDGQTGFYNTVEQGRLVEWRMADDCWARYQATAAPTGTGTTRDVAVRWYSYAYDGCSGAIDLASADVTFDWDPADVRSSALNSPVRHGDWLLLPDDWDGALDPQTEVNLPEQAAWIVDVQRFCQSNGAATLSVPRWPPEGAVASFRRPGTPLART